MPRRPLPPPEQLTAADLLHIGLGALAVPLGVTILARTLSIAVTVPGLMVGAAFIAFGLHRLWLARSRYRLYQLNKRGRAK